MLRMLHVLVSACLAVTHGSLHGSCTWCTGTRSSLLLEKFDCQGNNIICSVTYTSFEPAEAEPGLCDVSANDCYGRLDWYPGWWPADDGWRRTDQRLMCPSWNRTLDYCPPQCGRSCTELLLNGSNPATFCGSCSATGTSCARQEFRLVPSDSTDSQDGSKLLPTRPQPLLTTCRARACHCHASASDVNVAQTCAADCAARRCSNAAWGNRYLLDCPGCDATAACHPFAGDWLSSAANGKCWAFCKHTLCTDLVGKEWLHQCEDCPADTHACHFGAPGFGEAECATAPHTRCFLGAMRRQEYEERLGGNRLQALWCLAAVSSIGLLAVLATLAKSRCRIGQWRRGGFAHALLWLIPYCDPMSFLVVLAMPLDPVSLTKFGATSGDDRLCSMEDSAHHCTVWSRIPEVKEASPEYALCFDTSAAAVAETLFVFFVLPHLSRIGLLVAAVRFQRTATDLQLTGAQATTAVAQPQVSAVPDEEKATPERPQIFPTVAEMRHRRDEENLLNTYAAIELLAPARLVSAWLRQHDQAAAGGPRAAVLKLLRKHGFDLKKKGASDDEDRPQSLKLLRHFSSTSHASAAVVPSNDADGRTASAAVRDLTPKVRRMHAALSRYPDVALHEALAAMLDAAADVDVAYTRSPPVRASGAEALQRAMKRWVADGKDSAGSAQFTQSGCWVMPQAQQQAFAMAFFFLFVMILMATAMDMMNTTFIVVASLLQVMGAAAVGVLIRVGERRAAKVMLDIQGLIVLLVFGSMGLLVLLGCSEPHTYRYDPVAGRCKAGMPVEMFGVRLMGKVEPSPMAGREPNVIKPSMEQGKVVGRSLIGVGVGFALACAAFVHLPHLSFYISYIAMWAVILFFAGNVALSRVNTVYLWLSHFFAWLAATIFGHLILVTLLRKEALRKAAELTEAESTRYEKAWAAVVARDGEDALSRLEQVWHRCNTEARERRKKAEGDAGAEEPQSLFALFAQADACNDLLQQAIFDVFHGDDDGNGHPEVEVHSCAVKTEARTLQKTHCCYGGDIRQLSDLCRASVVFESIPALIDGLEKLEKCANLVLSPQPDRKMRFHRNYDAAKLSGGYRDVQLHVFIRSEEARRRGVTGHCCEVQLHLRDYIELKTEGGHERYKRRRNLRGE